MADLENTNALTTTDAPAADAPATTDNQPTDVTPVADGTDAATQPAPATDGTAPTADAANADADKPKKTPWWEGRIKQTTWEKKEAQRRAETAEAEAVVLREQIAAMQRGNGEPSAQEVQPAPQRTVAQPVLTQDDINRRAEQIANERFAAQTFNDQCNKTYEAGKAEFKDFDAARDQLATNFGDILQSRPDFLEAINAVPGGHKVFYELGMNPETAAHMLTLPPVRLTAELALMGAKLSAPKSTPVSGAPKPITPVGGTAQISNELTDDLPKDEWFKRREEQLKARKTGTR